MKKIFLSFLLVMVGISHTLAQGLDANVEQRLKDFFTQYETSYANIGKCKLDRYEVNHNQKKLDVYASPSFGYQPFTPENTEAIYRLLKQSLPGPVNYYDITIYADGKSIEDLVPNYLRKKQDKSRLWQRTDYKGNPWVKIIPAPLLLAKDWKADTSPFGKATENIIRMTKDVGNGNVHACSVPQRICSPNHSSYLILYPCWKMQEP